MGAHARPICSTNPSLARCLAGGAALLGLLAIAPPAAAEWPVDEEVVLEDLVAVRVLGREILALDGRGGGARLLQLEPGESVIWSGARGRIGVVLTDRRLLGVRSGSGWRSERARVRETFPPRIEVGERVALLATSKRLLAFDGSWRQTDLAPGEELQVARVGPGAAVLVTGRRALALTARSDGFLATRLHLQEDVQDVFAGAGLAEVTTSRRVLVFSGFPGIWSETRRRIH